MIAPEAENQMPDSLQCYLQTVYLVVQRDCLSVNHQVHVLDIRREEGCLISLLGWFFDIPNSFPVFIPALVRGPMTNNLLPDKLSSRPEFLTEGERRVSAGARTSHLAHVM